MSDEPKSICSWEFQHTIAAIIIMIAVLAFCLDCDDAHGVEYVVEDYVEVILHPDIMGEKE